MFNKFILYAKKVDLVIIWIILLLFNFKIGGWYLINFIAILLFIYLLIIKKYYKPTNLLIFLLIIILSFYGYLNSGFYYEPFKYLFNFFQFFIFFEFFSIRLKDTSIESHSDLKYLFEVITLFYLALAFIEFKVGSIIWFESRNYNSLLPRVNLGFGDSNSLAGFLLIFNSLDYSHSKFRSFYIFLVGLLTFSRSFLIAFVLNILVYLKTNIFLILSLILCIIFLALYFDFFDDYTFAINRVLELNSSVNPREQEWRISLNGISIIPNWSIFKLSLDPHNSFLLCLNLLGPIGLICIVYLFYINFRSDFSIDVKPHVRTTILIFLVFCLFNSELFSIRNTVALGIVLAFLKQKK